MNSNGDNKNTIFDQCMKSFDSEKDGQKRRELIKKVKTDGTIYEMAESICKLIPSLGNLEDIENEMVSSLLAKEDNSINDFNTLLLIYFFLNNINKVIELLNRVLEKDPKAPVHMTMGDIYNHILYDEDKAIKYYHMAVYDLAVDKSVFENYRKLICRAGLEYKKAQNYEKAIPFLEKAANYYDIKALNTLGVMYQDGVGVPKDIGKAQEYYEKAIEAGQFAEDYRPIFDRKDVSTSNNNLACLLATLEPDNSNNNLLRAMKYFHKSAVLGNPKAMYNIGCMHYNGLGTPSNREEAWKWFTYAANAGNEDAIKALEEIFGKTK